MNNPPAYVDLAQVVSDWLVDAKAAAQLSDKFEKVKKAIKFLREVGPGHPGFHTHKMENLPGPDGRDIWNSYIENNTANAWRMYWLWEDDGGITVVSVGPHTHNPGTQPQISRKGKMADS
ncbi:hypothetical protein [Rhodococcus sp. KRD175]|uniref:hypothetical protein n=1 Tax=Rhodococcus sp. KRD175 TaxID=2729729 RepID=UPI0019CFE6E2|nr:hypothetical protein [Rhodococcus sp. KRD175]